MSGSRCEKKRLCFVSNAAIDSISSWLNSKSKILKFSIILSLRTDFGITTTSLCVNQRKATFMILFRYGYQAAKCTCPNDSTLCRIQWGSRYRHSVFIFYSRLQCIRAAPWSLQAFLVHCGSRGEGGLAWTGALPVILPIPLLHPSTCRLLLKLPKLLPTLRIWVLSLSLRRTRFLRFYVTLISEWGRKKMQSEGCS